MTRPISTIDDLMTEAAAALIRRDPQRLEEIAEIAGGWMQTEQEADAQRFLLMAMTEAADQLLDQPSHIEIDDEGEAA